LEGAMANSLLNPSKPTPGVAKLKVDRDLAPNSGTGDWNLTALGPRELGIAQTLVPRIETGI
jgi:hypothetical protein